jgi:hypothetical protein
MNNYLKLILIIAIWMTHTSAAISNCISGVVTHASLQNCPDGAISITVSGGFSPLTYQWSGPNNFSSTQEDITSIKSGTYTVTVTDGLCGTATAVFQVNYTHSTSSFYVSDKKNISACGPGGSFGSGSISITVPSGTYTYNWSGPDNFSATTKNISSLNNPGDYFVTITNSSGCTVVIGDFICCCEAEIDPENPSNFNACSGSSSTLDLLIKVHTKIRLCGMFMNFFFEGL